MRAIEEIREERNRWLLESTCLPASALSDEIGLSTSSKHFSASQQLPSRSPSANALLQPRMPSKALLPLPGSGKAFVDFRKYANGTVIRSHSTEAPLAHPFSFYPPGHYFSDEYATNFPKSHFSENLPPVRDPKPSSPSRSPSPPLASDPLMAYLRGESNAIPYDNTITSKPMLKGITYVDNHNGGVRSFIEPAQSSPVLLPINKDHVAMRAANKAVKRCGIETSNPTLPSTMKLMVNTSEKGSEVDRHIERRLYLQALYEGKNPNEWSSLFNAEVEELVTDPINPSWHSDDAAELKGSKHIENSTASGSQQLSVEVLPPIEVLTGPCEKEESNFKIAYIDVNDSNDGQDDEELNELLAWAQNLNPDAID